MGKSATIEIKPDIVLLILNGSESTRHCAITDHTNVFELTVLIKQLIFTFEVPIHSLFIQGL